MACGTDEGGAARPAMLAVARMPSMQHHPSQRLSDILAGAPLPVQAALDYALRVAAALRQLHEQGIVWGTASPRDILLGDESARLLGSMQGRGARPDSASPYAAPEQLAGSRDDPRSDIFALGAILYEMTAGRPAVAAGSGQALRGIPPPVVLAGEARNPEIAELACALNRFVAKCMARAPQDRWHKAQKAIIELKLLAAIARRIGEPVTAVAPVIAADRPAEARERAVFVAAAAAGAGSHASVVYSPPPADSVGAAVPAPPAPLPPAGLEQAAEPEAEPAPPSENPASAPAGPPGAQFLEKPGEERNAPGALRCPHCGITRVHGSRPRDIVEAVLTRMGLPVYRCHRCYFRFLKLGPLVVPKPDYF